MPLSVGDRLGRYEIRGFLGAGGMGEVYRAHDERLDRDVAIKILPEGLTHHPDRLLRFEREARAAAALNHPNILDVHDLGEHEGRAFIVTELLEGESLRSVIAGDGLTLQRALEYGRQIAIGLATAHDNGITHRDIKPANIFVTQDGTVKILDFGLAKLTRPEISPAETSMSPTRSIPTGTGVAMGTPGYMPPELLRGKPTDHRSDIFSFGIVLYEMVAGKHPFSGTSSADVQAAILKEEAPTLSQFNPKIPPLLEHLVSRCLEKLPEDRFQSARELLFALEELSTGEVTTARPRLRASVLRRSSLAALVVATVIAAAFIFQRSSQGIPFQERDWLLITDVENFTGDSTFDTALDPALTVAIEQSRYVNVLSRASMQPVLRQMRRTDALEINETLGREIALRRGIDVILVPSVSKLGSRFILTASLKSAASGSTYASRIVRADGIDEVLTSLDSLCRQIRGDLGETLGSITERSKPLTEATTSSLDALEQFSLAHERHLASDPEGAMRHYEAALQIDPEFTTVKAALGILHLDWGHVLPNADPATGAALLSEAVTETESLTELEKLQILAHHAQFVEMNLERAAEYSEAVLSIYPDQPAAHHNLALIYERMGRTNDAIAEYKLAIEADPNLIVAYNGLVWLLRRRTRDVHQIVEWANREIEIADDQPWPHTNLSWAYIGMGDCERAVTAARRAIDIDAENLWSHYHLGHALTCAGKYEGAARAFEKVLELGPTHAWAHYHAGHVLEKVGETNAARTHFKAFKQGVIEMIDASPEDPTFPIWLDFARVRLGEEPQIRFSPEELDSADPNLDWCIAQHYSLTGRPQEAIDHLERALQNDIENPIWVLCVPTQEALYDEPRYQDLKRRTLGLEKGRE